MDGTTHPVQPEGDPRDDDDERGRDVDLYQVIAHGAHKLYLAHQARVVACGGV